MDWIPCNTIIIVFHIIEYHMCAMIAFIIIRDSIPHAYNAEFALSKYSIVLKSINITIERNATNFVSGK